MIQLTIVDINPHINFAELCHCTNVSEEHLHELIEFSIVVPTAGTQPQEWLFNITAVSVVKKANRLHRDLDIDWAGIALALSLLDDIEQLRAENERLKQRLSRFMVGRIND